MENVVKFCFLVIIFYLLFRLLFWPIRIAQKRNIESGQIVIISFLCFLTFIFPITWFVALIMAGICKPTTYEEYIEVEEDDDEIEKLANAYKLYRDGGITRAQYMDYKKKLLKGGN